MKRVGKHPNVVKLLGFCTQHRPLIMIMEYVGCGDLVSKYRFKLGMSIIWGSDYLYKYQIVQIPKTQVLVSKTNS